MFRALGPHSVTDVKVLSVRNTIIAMNHSSQTNLFKLIIVALLILSDVWCMVTISGNSRFITFLKRMTAILNRNNKKITYVQKIGL